ncbi:hypothetical protein IAT38_005852 [Cryptococcus sp. DSM 104549]
MSHDAPPSYYAPPASVSSLPSLSGSGNASSQKIGSGLVPFTSSGSGLDARAAWTPNGDVNIWIDIKSQLGPLPVTAAPSVKEYAVDGKGDIPVLSVVVFFVGNKDEIVPFVALACELILLHGHRVRIACEEKHANYIGQARRTLEGKVGRGGVRLEDRLEMYPIVEALDPNPSAWGTKSVEGIMRSFYQSTFSAGKNGEAFAADVIISCPAALGHISVAELQGLPIHIVSTTPFSPTTAFSHPMATIQMSNTNPSVTNYLSYPLVENQHWSTFGSSINNFRVHSLGLRAIDNDNAPGMADRLKVPWTYCWSPSVLSKPEDWKENIDISGFITDHQGGYRPDDDLLFFLKQEGKACVYVRLDLTSYPGDPDDIIGTIVGGASKMSIRVVLNVGGLDVKHFELSPDVHVVKHGLLDWILSEKRVVAMCHSGDPTASAAALRHGIPSITLPAAPSSLFWSSRLYNLGVSPRPLPLDELSMETFVSALDEVCSPDMRTAATEVSQAVGPEDGTRATVESVHSHLPLLNMRCDIIPSLVALWYLPEHNLHLSAVAAGILVDEGKITFKQLELNRPKEYPVSLADSDPITGGAQAFFKALSGSVLRVLPMFNEPTPHVVDISSQQPARLSQVKNSSGGWTWSYERDARQRGEVTDLKSGMREAGQEAWVGVKDGVKGFMVKPIDGLVNGGLIGGVKGIVGGTVGLVTIPLSGAISAVGTGVKGAALQMDARSKTLSLLPSSPADVLRGPRQTISIEEARAVSSQDRRRILEEYKRARGTSEAAARQMRSFGISKGLEVEPQAGGISLGSVVGFEKSDKKWWKGKGKGKERASIPSGSTSVSSPSGSGSPPVSLTPEASRPSTWKEKEAAAELDSARGY